MSDWVPLAPINGRNIASPIQRYTLLRSMIHHHPIPEIPAFVVVEDGYSVVLRKKKNVEP
ncbi:hypothetical protein BDV30DRAFT_147649 [Aspergillus minisclerotigenes]|uniref:Uncharacterized protein n=1 Tax=Aspergillus minisclerotigenes TaxID=656917 RepID=A0A5N6IYE6_9EURO|nr:hypothetical protein BDV30DRAFT_147649 [Aspergillus minisclerotigenes]